jgi:hypothetical protein
MNTTPAPIYVAAIKKDPGPIPELNPPREQIAIDVPEKVILGGVILVGFAVLLLGRLLHRPKIIPPLPPEHPAVIARRNLSLIQPNWPPALAATEAAGAVRGYLRAAFGLGEEELTTSEIGARFEAHFLANPGVASDVHEFLRECDAVQFGPGSDATAESLTERAFALIVELEQQRVPLTSQTPPLPVAT